MTKGVNMCVISYPYQSAHLFWLLNAFSANSDRLLFVIDITSLEKCYKKRNKALLEVHFLKNCETLNVTLNFFQFDIPLAKQK